MRERGLYKKQFELNKAHDDIKEQQINMDVKMGPGKDDFDVILSDEVKAQMEADPAMASAMRGIIADMRQAAHGVHTGKYPSFDVAMEMITGSKPTPVDLDDLDIDEDE